MLQTTTGDTLTWLILLAASVRNIPGEAAECGVLQGGTLRAISICLPEKRILGFDTFNGLPAGSWQENEPHMVGEFSETSFELVSANLADRKNIILIPGMFPDSCAPFDDYRFAFVYIDFDFYLSTLAAIDWFHPRMSAGGLMVFDDFDWPMCPGVRRAIEERGLPVDLPCGYQAVHRILKLD